MPRCWFCQADPFTDGTYLATFLQFIAPGQMSYKQSYFPCDLLFYFVRKYSKLIKDKMSQFFTIYFVTSILNISAKILKLPQHIATTLVHQTIIISLFNSISKEFFKVYYTDFSSTDANSWSLVSCSPFYLPKIWIPCYVLN